MRTGYIEVEVDGTRFRLYLDGDDPTLLHIFARHGMQAVDAAHVFFQGKAVWNETRKRFETRVDRRVLFWAWLHGREGGTVLVLSCFEKQEQEG